jgi:mycoredoxin
MAAHPQAIHVYTTPNCGDCVAVKRALQQYGLTFTEVDITQSQEATSLVERINDGKRSVPTVMIGDHAASLSRFSVRKFREFMTAAGVSLTPLS